MRGRRPEPPELKLLRGNPGRRRLPARNVAPTPGASRPTELSPAAVREWRRLMPELLRLGIMTQLDRAALSCLCEAWADFDWAVRRLERDGRVIRAPNGARMQHPAMVIKRQAMQKIREFTVEFGGSPAARARVSFEGPGDDGDGDEARFFRPRPVPAPPPAPRPKR